jgi:hypothetical protein
MSAMAEHDCISAHHPTPTSPHSRWTCPDCDQTWVMDVDGTDGPWYQLAWAQ